MNALAIQASESREIVLHKGWQIADQYIESESGTTAYKRSEYKRLLEDMEIDKFDIIVIKSIDRLMRSAKDWYIFLDKLTQYNKQLYIYIDNKFYTPDDSLLTGIKAILAEDFSRELSKKIKNAHKRRQNKKSGLNITSPMFGWDKMGRDKFVINAEEAEKYRLAFELAKEGKGFYTIAKIMYESGVRSKKGTRISEVQWRKMLYSPRAHGTVVLHQTEYDFEAKKKIYLPESEWIYIENALPPIVSKEYHEEFLEAMSRRRVYNDTRHKGFAGLYDLSGKIYCAECGAVYYRRGFASGTGKIAGWKCSNALKHGRKSEKNPNGCENIHVAEDVVMELIEVSCEKYYDTLFGQEESIAEEAVSIIRSVICKNNCEKELAGLKKEIGKLKKKKQILMHKLMEEVIEDADFKAVNQEVSAKLEQLQCKIYGINLQNEKYNNYEERLFKIKEALENGIIHQAKTKELISRADKIYIHANGKMEICFNRLKMLSLLKICDMDFIEENVEDDFFKMQIWYEHKTRANRKREAVNQKILSLLQENPKLMLKELPDILGVSASYIYTSVKELKEKGLLLF